MNHLTSFLSLLACLFFTSCIEIKEEIWVNEDLSGKAEVKITGPSVILASHGNPEQLLEKLRKSTSTEEGVSVTAAEVSRKGGQTTIDLHINFQDSRNFVKFLQKLTNTKKDSIEAQLIGELDLDIDFPNYHFSRKLDFSELAPPEDLAPAAQSLLANASFSSTIHLPNNATENNATSTSSNSTLTWNIPLSDLLKGQHELKHSAAIPLPKWIYYAPLIVVALIIWFIFRVRKKRRDKKLTPLVHLSPDQSFR